MEYVDVAGDPAGVRRMMEYSKGKRQVPVIVDGDKVLIGYGGS